MFSQNELNMRQRWWMDFLKDYDCTILYHPGRANVVAGLMAQEWLLIEAFSLISASVVPKGSFVLIASLAVRLDLETEIQKASGGDQCIHLWIDECGQPKSSDF